MIVNVVELWPQPRVQTVSVEGVEPEPVGVVHYVPLPRGADLLALDNTLYRLPALSPEVASAIVFRVHQSDVRRFKQDAILQESLLRRFETRPLWLLSANVESGEHTLVSLQDALPAEPLVQRSLIQAVRHAELRTLAQRPGALLPRSAEFHYDGPNGDHYDSFLRAATALQSVAAVDAVTFWLLPKLAGCDLVVLDSWTVLTVGLNSALYVRDLRGGELPAVEAIHRYDEPEEEIRRRCEIVAQRAGRSLRALLVVSVSSSGRLTSRIEQVLREAPFIAELSTVALFSSRAPTGDAIGESLCPLGEGLRRYSRAECPLCAARSVVIPIDPNTYLSGLSGHDKRSRVRLGDASQSREFFERYRNCGCVSIHRDQHDGIRHHMIHLNVDMLMKHETFRTRLEERIQEIGPGIDLIISPEHDAAMALAEQVAERMRVRRIACEPQNFLSLSQDDREAVAAARGILIVDDVVITGRRIFGFKNFLAKADLLSKETQLSGFVGVARPQNDTALQGVRDTLSGLHWVDKVILPDWHQKDCPWCMELAHLGRLAPQLKDSPSVRSRYALLRNTARGLTANLFLVASTAGSGDLKRSPQIPIFGDLHGVELFASVASTVQVLRGKGDLDESVAPPVVRVLEPEEVLGAAPLDVGLTVAGRFYDPTVKASLLRAVRRNDIRAPSTEQELQKAIDELLQEPSYEELRAEIILGIIEGKLPKAVSAGGDDPACLPGRDGVTTFLKLALKAM